MAQVSQLDEITVEILHKEQRVAMGRPLDRADDFYTLVHKVVVPPLCVSYIEADVRQSNAIPRNLDCCLARLELKNLDDGAPRYPEPTELAGWLVGIDTEERPDTLGRRIGHPNEWATKDVPIELHCLVKIGNGDASVAERSHSHRGLLSLTSFHFRRQVAGLTRSTLLSHLRTDTEFRLFDVISDPEGLSHDGQSWINGCGRREERGVNNE
tara:strand:- start:211 stop:846 length:636 start_codon:yes stop_codon:yes gene_type:complete